ncbi:hypothetical protein [Paenibacillus motobuensis]
MTKGITLQEIDASATSRLVIKDSAGRAKIAAPSAADDIARKDTVDNAVGTLSSLLTTAKTNTVAAINELFTNVSDGKNAVAAAITGKGVQASGSDTFAQLAAKIGQIITGKRFARGLVTPGATKVGYLNWVTLIQTDVYEVFINNLGFKPGLIILRKYSGYATHLTFVTEYDMSPSAALSRAMFITAYENASPSIEGYRLRYAPNVISCVVPVDYMDQYEYIALEADS